MLERFAKAKSLSFRNGSLQWVVFYLDWGRHDEELATMFRRWLKQNRPQDVKALEMRGRGHPTRKGRANLKYLSAYRLRRRMSRDDAIAFLEDEGGKLKPYRSYPDWDLAVKKAKAIIHSLEEGTFILAPFEGSLGMPVGEKFSKAAGLD
jgi:hypothetical protein